MRNQRYSYVALVALCLLLALHSSESRAEIALGAFGSWGSLKDSNASIPSVRESSVGVYALPSYGLFPMLKLGLYGEYSRVGQLTDPKSVSNYNKGFSGYLGGGALVISGPGLSLSGAYSFLGKGTLEKKTSAGKETTLEDPKGLHFILGVSVLPLLTLDLGYTLVKYDVHVGGVTSAQTRKWQDYRLGGSIRF